MRDFGIKRNLLVLSLVSFLNDIGGEMVHPILPLFLTSVLGTPVALVGLIEGVADSTSSILKVVSGWLSDKTGKRKPFIVAGYSLPAIARFLLGFALNWMHALALRFLDRAGKGIRTAPRDAVIAESTKIHRGLAFGFHRALDNMGAIVGPFLVLVLIPFLAMRQIFMLTLIPGIASVLLLLFFLKIKNQKTDQKLKFMFDRFDGRFKYFVFIASMFALANFSYAFFLLRAQELGASPMVTTTFYLIFSIVYAISAIPIGIASDKFGRKGILTIGYTLFGLVCLGFIFVNNLYLLFGLFAIHGIVQSILILQSTYVSDIVRAEYRTTALGTLYTAIGLATLPASVIAGALWQTFGFWAAFTFGAAVAWLAAVLLVLRKP